MSAMHNFLSNNLNMPTCYNLQADHICVCLCVWVMVVAAAVCVCACVCMHVSCMFDDFDESKKRKMDRKK